MDTSEAQMQVHWQLSKCLIVTSACAFGIGTSLISLSKRHAYPRPVFLLIALPILMAFRLSKDFSPDDFVNEIFARFLLIFLAHQSFLHWVLSPEQVEKERRTFGNPAPTSENASTRLNTGSEEQVKAARRNWVFAYKMLFNARCLGTVWKVRHTTSLKRPNFEAKTAEVAEERKVANGNLTKGATTQTTTIIEKQSIYRRAFILQRLGRLLLRFIALCLYYDPSFHLYMPDGMTWERADFSPQNQARYWRLLGSFPGFSKDVNRFLTRASLIRFHLVGDQMLPDYLSLSSYHDILSIIAVTSHLDTPEEWPSLFGQLGQAYTVRRYWSYFWHLLVYRSFSAHAEYVLIKVFGSRTQHRNAVPEQCIRFHLVRTHARTCRVDIEPGCLFACGCWATHWRYCLQIGAILVEEVFQFIVRTIEKRLFPSQEQSMFLKALHRLVGYSWVFIWTIWVQRSHLLSSCVLLVGG